MLPASTFEEGPLGLEGRHQWNSGIMLNNKTSGYPRAKLLSIPGLRKKPEADDNRAPQTGRDGEVIYPSLIRGKNVTYEGVIQALDLQSLRTFQTNLVAQFVPMGQGSMVITPSPGRGGVAFTALARCLEFDPVEEITRGLNSVPSPYQLEFTMTMRMHIPMFFAFGMPQQKVTVGTDTNIDVYNPSKAPTYPTLSVPFAAGATVNLYNDTIGAKLQFTALPNAGTLVLDFLKRTAKVGGVDVMHYMDDVQSNWWDEGVPGLTAGNNQIRQTGGSQITTDFYPTVW